jgi:hypothetical protein
MNLTIDFETLGTEANSPVISLGAVLFLEDRIVNTFYTTLDINQQIKDGRIPSGDTIKWWMNQSEKARSVFNEEAKDTVAGLKDFLWFVNQSTGTIEPWGNGSNFDITIIEHLLTMYNLTIPWKFWNIRDLRTFKEYVYNGKQTERKGVHHNALDDAIYQAQVVIDGSKQ